MSAVIFFFGQNFFFNSCGTYEIVPQLLEKENSVVNLKERNKNIPHLLTTPSLVIKNVEYSIIINTVL